MAYIDNAKASFQVSAVTVQLRYCYECVGVVSQKDFSTGFAAELHKDQDASELVISESSNRVCRALFT